jgi:hypothetical protein
MSMHFGGGNQPRNYRREGTLENAFVARPPSRIRQMDHHASPPRPQKSARHVSFDGTQQSRNHRGLQFDNQARKPLLVGPASRPPRFGIEAIHRLSTKVDQIAPGGTKNREKVLIIDCRIDRSEGIAHRPVKPGIALIEEAPGHRSRFPDEQQPHLGGTKRAPQSFPPPACGINRRHGRPLLPDRPRFRRPPGPRSSAPAFPRTG